MARFKVCVIGDHEIAEYLTGLTTTSRLENILCAPMDAFLANFDEIIVSSSAAAAAAAVTSISIQQQLLLLRLD